MSDFVLDTNIVLHFTRKTSTVAAQVQADHGIRNTRLRPMICAVTLGEIRAFAQGWPEERLKLLDEVLAGLLVIDINREDVVREYAGLHKFSHDGKDLADLGSRGRNISHNDLWIAAAALAVNATVLTTDKDLLRLPNGLVNVIQVNAKTGITENTAP